MRSFRFIVLSGGGLTLLGALVLAGWIRHQESLVRLPAGSEAVSSSSALGWLLTGLAFVVTAFSLRRAAGAAGGPPSSAQGSLWPTLLGAALILLGLAAMGEWVGAFSFGLTQDPVETARWLNQSYPWPGRMRPLSALGFVVLGISFILLPKPNPSGWMLRLPLLLSFLTLGVGTLGVVSAFTPVSALFIGPALGSGLAFLVSGVCLLVLQSARPEIWQVWGGDDSQRITLLAGVIVVITGVTGIIGGFGVLYPQVIRELEENLTLSLTSRSALVEDAVKEAWQISDYYANQPVRVEIIYRVSHGRDLPGDRRMLERVVAQSSSFGFSAARFLDAAGRPIVSSGEFVQRPDLSVPLKLPSEGRLLWVDGYVLHTVVPVLRNGSRAGYLEVERRLGSLNELEGVTPLGKSVDFPVCARAAAGMDCFPFRSSGGKVLLDLPLTFNGRPVPLAYALEGKSGIIRTTDYRGVQVIAAYAPVGTLGLVAGFKIDAAEFYQPVARRLWPLLLLLLLVASGSILLLHFQVVPLVRKMKREIDERRIAEERLQHSEARLAEITATLGEGVYVLDARGAITFVNPEAERLLGWSAHELLGQDAHRMFHSRRPDGETVEEHHCPVHQSFHAGVTYRSNDEWFERKDGSFVPVALVSSPIVRDGKVVGSVASFVDVTEQKRIAGELARHRDHLEQLVEERTGELSKLNRELEAFSYSVSHDLRAPLRAINGYSGALREDYGNLVPVEAHHYLDRMQAATIRMGELVDGLLNLAQVVRSEPHLNEVDLSELAVSIAASLREAEPRRRVTFRIEPGVVAVGDETLLRVLLENLFLNAWKFTGGRDEGRIEFGSEGQGEERAFYVRDNGVGFDMQFAHKLFQPFERLHKHGEFAGNGIGLATVRRIVERHGGRVWATSGLDEGTTIHFVLGRQP